MVYIYIAVASSFPSFIRWRYACVCTFLAFSQVSFAPLYIVPILYSRWYNAKRKELFESIASIHMFTFLLLRLTFFFFFQANLVTKPRVSATNSNSSFTLYRLYNLRVRRYCKTRIILSPICTLIVHPHSVSSTTAFSRAHSLDEKKKKKTTQCLYRKRSEQK